MVSQIEIESFPPYSQKFFNPLVAHSCQRYYGKVGLIRTNKQGTQNINIALDCGENDNFDIPHPEVEAVSDMTMALSQSWKVGDFVECKFQDGKNWYHGRIADLNEDGTMCDIMYHDSDVSSFS